MDYYRETLDTLREWLVDFTRVSLTGAQTKKAVREFEAVAKPVKLSGTLEELRYMESIAGALRSLYKDSSKDMEMYYPQNTLDHETLEKVLELTEVVRFRKLMEQGYKKLFDLYEAPRYGLQFDKQVRTSVTMKKFHKALYVLNEQIESVSEAPAVLTDLYISVREMEGHRPPLMQLEPMYLVQAYQNKDIAAREAVLYVTKLGRVKELLEQALGYYRLEKALPPVPEYTATMQECVEALEEYVGAIRLLYMEVVFERITRVV